MKKIDTLLSFILSFGLAPVVQGQTMDEIINRHIDAMGGREKIMTLSSVLMTGTFKATGDTSLIPILTTKKHMIGSRIDIEANKTNNYQIVTPAKGWIFTPVAGDKEPRPLLEDQFKAAQLLLDLQSPFLNYKDKGNKVEMAGNETVNGSMCYKLTVTAPNTNVTVYFINSQSNLIVKTSTKMFQFGKVEDVETTYSDYKKNADGYWFAYSNAGPRGATHYDKITTNVAVDENIFKVN
jgi:hypothetical protein